MPDIIQRATEWDKQSKKFIAQWRDLEDCVQHGRYVWQPKYDGVHAIIDTTEKRAYTREQKPLHSIQHVVDYLSRAVGDGHIFQGEVWVKDTPFHDISGAARRHAVQPHLGVVLYDWHDREDFLSGVDTAPYSVRYGQLGHELAKVSGWPHITRGESYPVGDAPIGGWQILAQEYVRRGGYDGLILRNADAGWVAGDSRLGELIKVKPSVTLDLRCNGVLQGEGKHYGKLGALTVSFNGVNTNVGTGFSDDERVALWVGALMGVDSPIGQIVEVECMCVNTNNTLREPRFKGVRWDKSEPDA